MLVALVLPSTSAASEASYLYYSADQGEANELTLTKGPNAALGQTWTWSDSVAQITADPRFCVSGGDHRAFCHPFEPTYYEYCHLSVVPSGGHSACARGEVYLGDENDRARIEPGTGFRWRLEGGRGHDDIAGAAIIKGGPGRDRLQGELGKDGRGVSLFGGRGNDRLEGSRAADRLRCGSGKDTVVADASDRVANDCEQVVQVAYVLPPNATP